MNDRNLFTGILKIKAVGTWIDDYGSWLKKLSGNLGIQLALLGLQIQNLVASKGLFYMEYRLEYKSDYLL